MSEWLNAELFTAVVIFYLINAVPSAMFGIALARRAGRPWWHGVLPAFLLPWLGLLFLGGQPAGEPYVTGPARYSMIMLFVAGLMVVISIWQPWVSGDGQLVGEPGRFEYSPNQVIFVAILVWLLALCLLLASVGLLFRGGFTVALLTAIIVSTIGGLLASIWYLFGPAGIFLSEARFDGARTELDIEVGKGALIALVALVAAYVAILVVPFGVKVREAWPVLQQPMPQPQWNGPQPPQQQWGGAPVQPRPQRPQGPGATW